MNIKQQIKDFECNGYRCNHETSKDHYVINQDELFTLFQKWALEIVGENDIHNKTHNPDYPKEKGYGACNCALEKTNMLRDKQRELIKESLKN